MKIKKDKKSAKQALVKLLKKRIRLLESEKQHYEQSPALMRNVKLANIGLVQNDIETLKKILAKAVET